MVLLGFVKSKTSRRVQNSILEESSSSDEDTSSIIKDKSDINFILEDKFKSKGILKTNIKA